MQISFDHLQGVFHRSPGARPRPAVILERLRQAPLDLSGFQPIRDPDFDEGRHDFEALRQEKAGRFVRQPPRPDRAAGRPEEPRPAPEEAEDMFRDQPTPGAYRTSGRQL
jgi:hypothetical protein